MVVSAVVLYPNEEGKKFDMDYYLATHMPLVAKHWGPMGLKSWEIVKFDAGLGGSAPAQSVQALLYWESVDSIRKALDSDATKVVFGDVPNFTDISPSFMMGNIMGKEVLSS